MKLESQVAPLALAQRMKALGFPGEDRTLFVWITAEADGREWPPCVTLYRDAAVSGNEYLAPAYSVAEMLVWLPALTYTLRKKYGADEGATACAEDAWDVNDNDEGRWACYSLGIAESLALLLLNLAESGALDPRGLR